MKNINELPRRKQRGIKQYAQSHRPKGRRIISKEINILIFIFFLIFCCNAIAFDDFVPTLDLTLIKTGSFGQPILIKDAAMQYSIPIKVYSSGNVDTYIPDITDLGWIEWHKQLFLRKGIYNIVIYDHFKNNSYCKQYFFQKSRKNDPAVINACSELRYRRRNIWINSRNNTVTVVETVLMTRAAKWHPNNTINERKTYSLSDPILSKESKLAFRRITSIVEKTIGTAPINCSLECSPQAQLDRILEEIICRRRCGYTPPKIKQERKQDNDENEIIKNEKETDQ